ncbi:MAG: hypothetical protein ACE5LC_06725 [Candidatus Aminicenantales bacterium]
MFIVPRVSRKEAENLLREGRKFFRFLRNPPLKNIELIFIPFYIFEILLSKEGGQQSVNLAVDGLLGHAVLFVGDNLVFNDHPGIPILNCEITLSQARKLVLEEYRALLLEYSLKTRSFSEIEENFKGRKIYYPFWVGYFRKKRGYDFKALDAVSAEIQGVKMRRVFIRAFRQSAGIEEYNS